LPPSQAEAAEWDSHDKQSVAEGAYVYITGRREKELDAAIAKIGKKIAGD
jgi:hypothetical protein